MVEFKAAEETREGFGNIKRFSSTPRSGYMWVCWPRLLLCISTLCIIISGAIQAAVSPRISSCLIWMSFNDTFIFSSVFILPLTILSSMKYTWKMFKASDRRKVVSSNNFFIYATLLETFMNFGIFSSI